MPSVVIITPGRRKRAGQNGVDDTYHRCPLTESDITIKVCVRNNAGEKVPLAGVRAGLTGFWNAATTNAEGIAKFIGFPPTNGSQPVTITVTLVGADANR